MCTRERDLRRCIYMYFSAFNPKKLGSTWMVARRLFSIPLQCSSEWPDFTMWILTSASLSVAIDRPVGSSWWSINCSCNNYHPLSSLYCIAAGPARLVRHNIVDNVLFLAILPRISARNILHNIVDDVLFIRIVCLKNICVFSHYMLWYMTVYIIRYLCIFSLHVECCRSWKSLIDGSSYQSFDQFWSGSSGSQLIDQKSSQVFAPKIAKSSSGNSVAKT